MTESPWAVDIWTWTQTCMEENGWRPTGRQWSCTWSDPSTREGNAVIARTPDMERYQQGSSPGAFREDISSIPGFGALSVWSCKKTLLLREAVQFVGFCVVTPGSSQATTSPWQQVCMGTAAWPLVDDQVSVTLTSIPQF